MTHEEQLYQKDLIIQKLEQQLAEKDREISKLKVSLKDLKEEISECYVDGQDYVELREQKDKEIERLKYQLSYYQAQAPKEEIEKFNSIMLQQAIPYQSQIRKQVCDEIRKTIDNEKYELYGDSNRILSIHADEFNNLLNKIEKGEE